MGNFYTNYTLRGPSQTDVANALSGRRARITPSHNGCVVVFDEASDSQDTGIISELASKLSAEFGCPVLSVLNHDDDILWYQLYADGALIDEYDSTPGYFDPASQPSSPIGGDSDKICAVFDCHDRAAVERVLRKSTFDDDGYVFAMDRHADLVSAIGLSAYAVGTAYASFDYDELPEGLSQDKVMHSV
jgi:hypothetical protein